MASIKINKILHEIKIDENISLLDNLLNEDIEIGYSCLSGICENCKTKVISGAENIIKSKNHFAKLNNDEVLLCCCKIKNSSNNIELFHDNDTLF